MEKTIEERASILEEQLRRAGFNDETLKLDISSGTDIYIQFLGLCTVLNRNKAVFTATLSRSEAMLEHICIVERALGNTRFQYDKIEEFIALPLHKRTCTLFTFVALRGISVYKALHKGSDYYIHEYYIPFILYRFAPKMAGLAFIQPNL